jgi:hypothetical protein
MFGNQRLTGARLDRLTHHVHILEMNGESYRLKQSKARRRKEPQTVAVDWPFKVRLPHCYPDFTNWRGAGALTG